ATTGRPQPRPHAIEQRHLRQDLLALLLRYIEAKPGQRRIQFRTIHPSLPWLYRDRNSALLAATGSNGRAYPVSARLAAEGRSPFMLASCPWPPSAGCPLRRGG